jgi:Fe-S cluster assembly protein SufD
VAESGAQADLFLQSAGDSGHDYLSNTVVELIARPNARLGYTALQSEGVHGFGFMATQAFLAENSQVDLTTVTLAGKPVRHAVSVFLQGEEAACRLNGLNVLSNTARAYAHTEIHHQVPRCRSEQVYKNILDGDAQAEFDGIIQVYPHAQQTDARQLNKNLLLSNDAVAYTRPQLKIDADDVKCAHGATVGQLEPEELFYLQSRGLSAEVAQCLLTFGFAEDLIQNIGQAPVRAYLEQRVLEALGQSNSPLNCFTSCVKGSCARDVITI